jgi:hypothetical protein
MPKCYLRMEGVNLQNFIGDTDDLSTVRGGSLLLLHSIRWIARMVTDPALGPVTTGASSGIFEFEASDLAEAETVRDNLWKQLAGDHRFKHATFVVDIVEATADFVTDRERLIALNRFRQMQSPTVALPARSEDISKTACVIDRRRPGTRETHLPERPSAWVSESVYERRECGKDKGTFYQEQTEMQINREFVQDLDELTNDEQRGNLHHKMAVIYLDGNGFGKLQNELCRTQTDQRRFDETVRRYRREMLQSLVRKMESEPEGWFTSDTERKFRLETLLWGGDEVIWVVPAWQGWRTLAFFYEQSQGWNFDGHRLSHAGGLVFCHHNAPIQRITKLARDLAELAKEKDRGQNLFAYEVLESFDHIGRDLESYREERSPQGKVDAMILSGKEMEKTLAQAALVTEQLPSRRLHKMVELILRRRQPVSEGQQEAMEKGMEATGRAALAAVTDKLGGAEARWLHLAALRDYLV